MVRKRGVKKQNYREKSKRIYKERRLRHFFTRIARYGILPVLLIVISLSVWLYKAGYVEKFGQYIVENIIVLSSYAGLNLEVVYHDGTNMVLEDELLSFLPLEESGYRKIPLYSLDLDALKYQMESLGWIESVAIERNLPNALVLTVKERNPQAIWQYKGQLYLIDRSGALITKEGIEQFARLPVIVGEDANTFFESLYIFMSEEPELMDNVQSIIRVGGRRWNVRMKNGIEIKLPEEKPDVAWRRLAKLQREKKILDRKIKYIDLRVEDRLFILSDEK